MRGYMKKWLIIFLTALSLIYAEENHKPVKHSFTYIKLGVGSVLESDTFTVLPLVALGKRFQYGFVGLDFSANYMAKELKNGVNERYWAAPKILWLLFLQPRWNWSFYFGVGASYGSMKSSQTKQIQLLDEIETIVETQRFRGILGEGTFGIEIASRQKVKSFVEVNASYTVASSSEKHKDMKNPAVSVGVGIAF